MADDLQHLERELRAAAGGIGALVLESLPMRDIPLATLDSAAFRQVMEHVRPRILYLAAGAFDLEEELQEGLEGDAPLAAQLEAVRRRHHARQGACCQVTAGVVVEGVLHLLMETADWYEQFEAELELAREEAATATALARAAADADEEAGFREYALKLAGQPAFSQGRPSVEKRRALAQHLFRELDESEVYRVTSMADLISWLQSHGLQPD